MNRKIWTGLGVVLLILGMVTASVWNNRQAAAEVDVTRLKTVELSEEVMTSGTLEPKQMEKIDLRPEWGELKEILVEEGDKVDKDEPVLRYRNPSRTVKSRQAGTVVAVNGDATPEASTQPLVMVADLSGWKLSAEVSEFDALKIQKGQKVSVTSDVLPDETWTGKVERVAYLPKHYGTETGPSGESESILYSVEIRLDQKIPVKLGSRLMAVIRTQPKTAKTLPKEALIQEGSGEAVFVVEDGRAVRKKVRVGITDGKRVEILSGVSEKDRVIVHPPKDLQSGREVKVR